MSALAGAETAESVVAAQRRRLRLRVTGLWVAFAAVQLALVLLARYAPGWALGDVDRAYADWARAVIAGRAIPGLQTDFVYPVLALVPMLVSALGGLRDGFAVAWLIQVVVVNALAFAILVGRGRSRPRLIAAAFLLAGWLLLGPVSVGRIDAITVALAVVSVLLLRAHPAVASWLAALGAWTKIWPAAILAVQAFVARRWRAAVLAPVLIAVVVLAAATVAGSPLSPLSFLSEQSGRGMQVESVASTPLLIGAAAGVRGMRVYYDQSILTYEVSAGTGAAGYGAVLTVLQLLAVLAILGLSAWCVARGVSWLRIVPVSLLALVLALIVFNKVGSPQFESWLLAPVVLWLVVSRRTARVPAIAVLGIELLTQAIYPYYYPALLDLNPVMLGIITVRNAALVALLIWCLVRIGMLWKSRGTPALGSREAVT